MSDDPQHLHPAPDVAPVVRVSREVPLPWLITMVGTMVLAGIGFYVDQQRQWDKAVAGQAALTETLAKLVGKVEVMSAQIGSKDLKDVQHDLQISDLTRRVEQLENPRNRR